jgi:hypothetical protein
LRCSDVSFVVDSQNGEYGLRDPDQSGRAPQNFTALAHFSASSAMSFLKSAAEPGLGKHVYDALLWYLPGWSS